MAIAERERLSGGASALTLANIYQSIGRQLAAMGQPAQAARMVSRIRDLMLMDGDSGWWTFRRHQLIGSIDWAAPARGIGRISMGSVAQCHVAALKRKVSPAFYFMIGGLGGNRWEGHRLRSGEPSNHQPRPLGLRRDGASKLLAGTIPREPTANPRPTATSPEITCKPRVRDGSV